MAIGATGASQWQRQRLARVLTCSHMLACSIVVVVVVVMRPRSEATNISTHTLLHLPPTHTNTPPLRLLQLPLLLPLLLLVS